MSNEHTFPGTFDGLLDLVAYLRGPEGCPWDRKQTAESLKADFREECYELLEAIERGDSQGILEELGDILLHVVFQIQIAKEASKFSEGDVFVAQIEKLVRRHPHVFGGASAADALRVETQWEALKQGERKGVDESLLGGVPESMPALAYAQVIQKRAARSGFDWDDIEGVLRKTQEEVDELQHAKDPDQREKELGDLLFSIVNVARWLGVEAEGALRRAGRRFYRRFALMEKLSRERGLSFSELPLDDKEALWQEAKGIDG